MLTVLAFCNKDQDQAERLAGWMADLGGCRGHEILLGEDSSVTNGNIAALFQQSFDKVTVLPIANPYDSWPSAPNHCYSILARHIENEKLAPYWFWLEPDAVILRSGALDAIEAEYKEVKKPFLGALVTVEGVANHMSGLGIYPGQMTRHAGLALISNDIAWDVGGAEQILPHMHDSKLIAHKWNHKPFENWEQVERDILIPHPEALIYHASKDGSLIDLLRARMNLSGDPTRGRNVTEGETAINAACRQPATQSQLTSLDGCKANPSRSFTTDILIKSYPKDYEWLSYCLRAIDKFANGFRQVVVICPKDAEQTVPASIWPDSSKMKDMVRWVPVVENGDGYLFQQAIKASAHEFTDADYVLHIDSDVILTQPITPESFFHEGKPIWYISPYSELGDTVPWQPFTEKFIGEPVQFEFMRRFPQLVPRKLHLATAGFCMAHHKMRLTDYILSQPNREFSEFNALGALAYSRAREDFHWINPTKGEPLKPFAIQYWSHQPITDEIREELEKILEDTPSEVSPIRQTKEGIWVLTNDTHISKWIEETGRLDHDQNTLPLILPEIPVGGIVVDGGAFVGDHTIAYCNQVGPNGMVYAFEPNPDAYECLIRNITNQRPFHPYKMALGNVSDPTSFRAEKFRIEDNSGASHMDADGDQYVQIISLDSFFFERLDLLKLDVEGFELRALQGAEQTINRCHPVMVIEINDSALARQGVNKTEVYDWLRNHGYQWMPVQELLVADPPQYDILCKPIRKAGDVEYSFTSARYLMENGKYKEVPVPWANREKSIAYIDQLAAELKKFMTAPRSTLVVRERLRKLKVITKVR